MNVRISNIPPSEIQYIINKSQQNHEANGKQCDHVLNEFCVQVLDRLARPNHVVEGKGDEEDHDDPEGDTNYNSTCFRDLKLKKNSICVSL